MTRLRLPSPYPEDRRMSEIDPRYPIGKYQREAEITAVRADELIDEIEAFPTAFRAAVEGLSHSDLEKSYREGGWTIREVVHHVADSHMNAYIRTRLALTEEIPTIKPYHEDLWAKLPDSQLPPGVSLDLLEALHRRWVAMLRELDTVALAREFFHPEQNRKIRLDAMLGLYAWHGRHHLAHIELASGKR